MLIPMPRMCILCVSVCVCVCGYMFVFQCQAAVPAWINQMIKSSQMSHFCVNAAPIFAPRWTKAFLWGWGVAEIRSKTETPESAGLEFGFLSCFVFRLQGKCRFSPPGMCFAISQYWWRKWTLTPILQPDDVPANCHWVSECQFRYKLVFLLTPWLGIWNLHWIPCFGGIGWFKSCSGTEERWTFHKSSPLGINEITMPGNSWPCCCSGCSPVWEPTCVTSKACIGQNWSSQRDWCANA